ncbi:MAG: hypothetical protein JWP41_2748 [Ramlibacter sp.]|nr:hypothetical protein [Ramlibacter sp.]
MPRLGGMITWKQALREGAVSGSLASVLSGAYLAWAGHRRGEAAAPINAVSHWFFGRRSLEADEPRALYTLTGYLTHHGASLFWAVLHAKAWGARQEAKQALPAAAGAIAAASIACFVDYQLTPKRFTPGFEHRLAKPEMVNVYACFALGLMVGSMLMRKR